MSQSEVSEKVKKLKSAAVKLGAIGIIYEARPNVTVDSVSLCLKAGNSIILRVSWHSGGGDPIN
ncbi:MAG: hypothetical protein QME05_02100 [Candidatus Margulisbacteria bacterium]|nr:hypothetical protein [Candidatus Margulisiibacteriota bacterium]